MKKALLIFLACMSLVSMDAALASYYSRYNYPCTRGNCAPRRCNGNEGPCQCADINCGTPDSACMSYSTCCQVFGNVGAR